MSAPAKSPPWPARELFALYVEFGPAKRAAGLEHLQKVLGRLFPQSNLQGRVIDTSGTSPAEPLGPLEHVASTNLHREFSGWQTGAHSLGAVSPDAAICICNDTFFANYGAEYLDLFDAGEVERALQKGEWIGYQESRLRPVTLFGARLERYLRTSFMLVRWRELEKVLPLELPVAEEAIFATEGPSLFREDAPLSANFKALIDCWLCRTDPLPGEFHDHWHHSEPLTSESRPRLQPKAKSILLEYWLAAKIQASGAAVFNARTSRARNFPWWALQQLGLLDPLQNLKRRVYIALRARQHRLQR